MIKTEVFFQADFFFFNGSISLLLQQRVHITETAKPVYKLGIFVEKEGLLRLTDTSTFCSHIPQP